MRTRRATPARLMTLGLAALCLVAQLSGLAHMALVPHVHCPEHGELVEATRPTPTPWVVRPSSDRAALEVFAAESSSEVARGHSHDHCIVTSTRRTLACPLKPSVATDASASLGQQARVGREPSRPTTLPLLAVAPKCSPPRA